MQCVLGSLSMTGRERHQTISISNCSIGITEHRARQSPPKFERWVCDPPLFFLESHVPNYCRSRQQSSRAPAAGTEQSQPTIVPSFGSNQIHFRIRWAELIVRNLCDTVAAVSSQLPHPWREISYGITCGASALIQLYVRSRILS